jgi:hypothetical protein
VRSGYPWPLGAPRKFTSGIFQSAYTFPLNALATFENWRTVYKTPSTEQGMAGVPGPKGKKRLLRFRV